MTTKEQVREWLTKSKAAGATHMLVVRDVFDGEHYPVDVPRGAHVRTVVADYNAASMQRVVEVYAHHLDHEAQLAVFRAMYLEDAPTTPTPEVAEVPAEPAASCTPAQLRAQGEITRLRHHLERLHGSARALGLVLDEALRGVPPGPEAGQAITGLATDIATGLARVDALLRLKGGGA